MDERLERAPFGVLTATADGTVTTTNDAAKRLLAAEDDSIEDAKIRSVFPYSVDRKVPDAFDTESIEKHDFEEYYPELDRWLSITLVPTDDEVTIYLQDVTDRKQADRNESDLRGELERVMISDSLISEILSEVVDASTREEIAETICERLGSTDIYEFAWVGEREIGDDNIVVRASAGATGRMLEPIRETLENSATSPEERAVESGELQIVQPLADDSSVPAPIRKAAFAGGIQSVLAIPLTYGSSVYGVVGVYAPGQEAFSARERESFQTVGEIAGLAVNAARHRNLLLSDSIVEITFRVAADSDPFVSVTTSLDVAITLDGLVPREDGALLCYVVVDGTNPERAANELTQQERSNDARLINHAETTGVVEVDVNTGTPLGVLLEHGATIESAEYEDGAGRIVSEFPPEEDVRRVADAVSRQFDGEVVAKRQRERDVTTQTEFRNELRDRLTDRQEDVLRTAFFSEYFESPRGSTAEEVAEALGVTGPTILYHLRAGQRKLLEAFFDARPTDARPKREQERANSR